MRNHSPGKFRGWGWCFAESSAWSMLTFLLVFFCLVKILNILSRGEGHVVVGMRKETPPLLPPSPLFSPSLSPLSPSGLTVLFYVKRSGPCKWCEEGGEGSPTTADRHTIYIQNVYYCICASCHGMPAILVVVFVRALVFCFLNSAPGGRAKKNKIRVVYSVHHSTDFPRLLSLWIK